MVINMQAVGWLALLVLMLVMEVATLGLTTIWFAGGALVAFFLSLAGVGLLPQIIVFCAVSFVLLIFTRPAAMRLLNRDRTKTNAASLVGCLAVVTEEICNLDGTGQVQVHGQEWTARAEYDDLVIVPGTRVIIKEIRGVKLIVKEE